MFVTATPVAAAMPHAFSPASAPQTASEECSPNEAVRIGDMLAKLVRDGNVRSMEALAVVIVASDWGQFSASAAMPQIKTNLDGRAFRIAREAGERIARRALAGALEDHSRGATRFHRAGDYPDWARGNRPCAQVGEFLFYRV